MKKKSKTLGIVGIAAAVLCVGVAVAADAVMAKYNTMISLYFRNQKVETNDELLADSRAITQKIEEEGITMLKGTQPLSSSVKKINLFGNGSYQTCYQGSGSASSWFKQDLNINMKQAFENSGYEVNEALWNFYVDNYTERKDQAGGVTDMSGASSNIIEQQLSMYESYKKGCGSSANVLEYSKNYSDTAVITFSRAGGEGGDAARDMTGVQGGDAGKHYLELQQVELDLLHHVEENYAHVIVVINSAVPMECDFLKSDKIEAAYWIGMPGSTGLNAVAEVIKGTVNPSGHTVDTWAYDLTSAPSFNNFGDFTYSNTPEGGVTSSKYVHYNEGIYVGYRYYETAAADGYINYDTAVQFPFGFGLSYTSFEWSNAQWSVGNAHGEISVSVDVKNTGSVAGKDVVELYYHAPYTVGGVEKAEVNLGGFAKTSLLQPGKSEKVTIKMNYDDLASYDYASEKAYILDAGTYNLSLRSDSHTVKNGLTHDFQVENKLTFNKANGARSTDKTAATNIFDDVTNGDGAWGKDVAGSFVSRSNWAGTFPQATALNDGAVANADVLAAMQNTLSGRLDLNIDTLDADHPGYKMPTTGADNGIAIADMAGLDFDDPKWDLLLDELSVADLSELFGNCGWHNPAIKSIKKSAAIDMDGAEGLHDLTTDKTGNQFTASVITAATWNPELAEEMGIAYGAECVANGVTGMYGFSMNTHRSPFGGRSFEYYSEDPVLSGKIAAGQVKGIQSKKVAVYCKHFILNEQETNRSGVMTWANEQAIREIYAKPFEIVTKEADCTGYMNSYNYVGHVWSSASYALNTTLLRDEWGSKGRVITDAAFPGQGYSTYSVDGGVFSGLDMWLAAFACRPSAAVTSSAYGVNVLRAAAHRQLYVFANSAAISTSAGFGVSNWIWMPILLNVALAAGAVCSTIFLTVPAFKKEN